MESYLQQMFGPREQFTQFQAIQVMNLYPKLNQTDYERIKLKQFLTIEEKIKCFGVVYIIMAWKQYAASEISSELATKLDHLYGLSKQDVVNFVRVLAKDTNKINTICFYGASNTGKSILARALLLPWEPGCIQRDGGMNLHWLENTLFVNYVIWEEPIVNCEIKEDLKLVLGGERVAINKKNKPLCYKDHRSPMIITTNQPFWFVDSTQAYINRMIIAHLTIPVNTVMGTTNLKEADVLRYLIDLYERD